MYGLGGTCPTPGVACASSELKACMASAGIANRGRSSAPVPAVNWVTLGSLWPWCTSPGQWLSWPKGDGVKCSRSEGPRRESRSEINETHPFITCRSFEGRPWYSPIAMIYEGPSLFLSTYFSILFYSILFDSMLFYSILFYFILCYSILFYQICAILEFPENRRNITN